MIVYEARRNADQNEGRGPMVTFALFDNEKQAVRAVKGQGVMGVGDGEVLMTTVYSTVQEMVANEKMSFSELVYGYRKDPFGKWGYGYADNREFAALEKDPEYQQYLKLKAKFDR